MIVTAHTPEDYALCHDFLKQRGVDVPLTPDVRVLGQLDAEKKLVAVIFFNAFVKRTCAMHAEGDGNWLTLTLLRAVSDYIFNDCGIVQLFGPISSENHKMLRMTRYLGFEELYRVPQGCDDHADLIVMGLHRSHCRWLEGAHDELQAA